MTVPGLAVTEADGVLTIRFDRPAELQRAHRRDDDRDRAAARGGVRARRRTRGGADRHRAGVQHRRRHRRGGRARALRRARAGCRQPADPVDHRLRQAGGGRRERHRRRGRALRRAGLRPHRVRGVGVAPAGLRPGRPDAGRRCDRHRGRGDRPAAGDADGAAGRTADGSCGVRRRAGLARVPGRRAPRGAGPGGPPAEPRCPARAGRHQAGGQRGGLAAARAGAGVRAEDPDHAAAHGGRRRGHAGLLREAPPHLPGRERDSRHGHPDDRPARRRAPGVAGLVAGRHPAGHRVPAAPRRWHDRRPRAARAPRRASTRRGNPPARGGDRQRRARRDGGRWSASRSRPTRRATGSSLPPVSGRCSG